MGLLDGLFLPGIPSTYDPQDAHRLALADLLRASSEPQKYTEARSSGPDAAGRSEALQGYLSPMLNIPGTPAANVSTPSIDLSGAAPMTPLGQLPDEGGPFMRRDTADNRGLLSRFFDKDAMAKAWNALEPATPPAPQPQEAQAQPGAPQTPQALQPWAASVEQAPAPSPVALGPWATSLQSNPAADAGTQAPAMAQPPAQAVPPLPAAGSVQATAPREIGIMDRLGALASGYNSGGLLGGIASASGARNPLDIEAQNQTYQALVARGIDPNTAGAAVLNPAMLQQLLPIAFPPKAPAIEKIGPDDRLINTVVGPDGRARAVDVTPSGDTFSGKTVQSRQVLAPRYGLQPGTVAYNAYVLNGKLPDVVPDHKAIAEADMGVHQSDHLIRDLQEALRLSPQAYSGPLAETRASIDAQLPGSHPDAVATTSYAKLIAESILPSLKSIFPGRITNTDFNYMQGLQPGASLSRAERETILRRGISHAQQILAEDQAKAKALRNGNYYQENAAPAVPTSVGADQIKAWAMHAIEQGADPNAVIARIKGWNQ